MSDNLQESTGYTALAEYYDRLMSDVRYDEWASFYEMVFHKYCTEQPTLVLDLGCGTGRLTCELSGRGYDMIGVDLSEDMLAQAAAASRSGGGTKHPVSPAGHAEHRIVWDGGCHDLLS